MKGSKTPEFKKPQAAKINLQFTERTNTTMMETKRTNAKPKTYFMDTSGSPPFVPSLSPKETTPKCSPTTEDASEANVLMP